MVGLVEEMQRDALDPNVAVSTLLRKAKLSAAKLQLPVIAAWVESELTGYKGDLPPYRKMHGIPKALNPMRGWIPIHVPAEIYAMISQAGTGQSVAEIEDLLNRVKGSTLHVPMSRNFVDLLNENMAVSFSEMSVFVGRSDIVGILDTVRNMVLDWAIELEKSGIRGEGMSFKPEEKTAAHNNPSITIGTVGTLVGVVGSHNHVRDIVGGNLNLSQIKDFALQLRLNHANLVNAGANDSNLSSSVDRLIIEVEKNEPDTGVVRGLLADTRSALAGAAGNLMASGALALIGTFLGS